MRNFLIGLFMGVLLSGVAYALTLKLVLIDSAGDFTGTASNPIHVVGI